MSITPKTYEEWIAIRDALAQAIQLNATVPPARRVDRITVDAFGPCPSKPAPEPFIKGGRTLVRISLGVGNAKGTLWITVPGSSLRPNEADGMALALTECAAYVRNQTTAEENA